MKELIVRAETKIITSNFEEWRKDQLAKLASINKDPKTPAEYGQAKADKKSCEDAEFKISKIRDGILAQSKDLRDIMDGLDGVDSEISAARLLLTKKIDAETARIKTKKVNSAIYDIDAACQSSPCPYAVRVDSDAIKKSIKGKSSEDSIDKALASEVERQKEAINTIVSLYLVNKIAVDSAEIEMPESFYDKKSLLLKNPEVVTAEIEARKAKFKLAMKEKAEREEAARLADEAAKKAEAERIEAAKSKQVEEPQPPAAKPIVAPPAREVLPPCNVLPPADIPPPPSFDDEVYTIMVEVSGTRAMAVAIANHVRTFADVTDVTVVEGYAVKCGE